MKITAAKSFVVYCDHDNYKLYETIEDLDGDNDPMLEVCHELFEACTGIELETVGDVAVVTLNVKRASVRSYKMVRIK